MFQLTTEPRVYIFTRRVQKPAYLAFNVMITVKLLINLTDLFGG